LAKFYVRIAQSLQNKNSSLSSFSDLDVNTPDISATFGIIRDMFDKHGEVLLVAGGEPTVTLLGDGKGGRNQELALAFEIESAGMNTNASFLSAGTDGQGMLYEFIPEYFNFSLIIFTGLLYRLKVALRSFARYSCFTVTTFYF
jgi:hypothetical protein